jgi:L-threonylcarbamoyladenylate synthase
VKEIKADPLATAVAALRRGDVIVFPTETLYGLGADALNFSAVEKVFQRKGRDPNNPFPVLISDRSMLDLLVATVTPLADKLMRHFWPGPLTLVLPARNDIPRPLMNSTGGVGVRISSQPIATAIVSMLGQPVTATSANPSGQLGAQTLAQAQNYFIGRIEVFVDGGTLTSATGSTVAAVSEREIKMIRAGEISIAQLQSIVGEGVTIR